MLFRLICATDLLPFPDETSISAQVNTSSSVFFPLLSTSSSSLHKRRVSNCYIFDNNHLMISLPLSNLVSKSRVPCLVDEAYNQHKATLLFNLHIHAMLIRICFLLSFLLESYPWRQYQRFNFLICSYRRTRQVLGLPTNNNSETLLQGGRGMYFILLLDT